MLRFHPREAPTLRLICFPHAGGGAAAYREWGASFPASVEVCAIQPPGRASRLREPPMTRLTELVDAAREAVRPLLDLPLALFGHSMGALTAFEVARLLERNEGVSPVHLFVSGRRAPHLPTTESPVSHLPNDLFIAEMRRRYGGIPDTLLREKELMDLFLPGLRADTGALEDYRFEAGDPLRCPIDAYGGRTDGSVTEEGLAAWTDHTSDSFRMRFFPGGHFFINEARPEVQGEILEALEKHLADRVVGEPVGSRERHG
jgi:medium-chain acyl-[acyl-carrier-protein] hydrolase